MNYLESIFNSIDQGIIILTPEGEVLFFNREAGNLVSRWGYSPLTLTESIFQIMPPEAGEKVRQILAEVKTNNEPFHYVGDQKGVDGNIIYTESAYIPVVEDGALTHINLLIRDVTENKIFEKRITGMATDLRNLFDQANAVIISTDNCGYITDWNRHDRDLTGYSKNDVLTKKMVTMLLAEPDRAAFEELLQQVIKGKPVLNVEVPILSSAGNRLTFLLSATPRTNSSGQVIEVIFIGQDITERRWIEQELRTAHERLVFHIENAPLGFIEWDHELKVKSWTKRAEEIFGWSEREFVESGHTGFRLIYDEDVPQATKVAEELLSGEVERNQVQFRNVTKDGSVIWCEWFNSVLKNKEGKVITIMSLVQDITERKKNEFSLEEAQTLAHLGNWEIDLRTQQATWSAETFRILGYAHETQPSLQAYLDVIHPEDRDNVKSIIGFSTKTFTPQSFYHRIHRHRAERTLFIVARYEFDADQKPIRLYGTMMDVTDITKKERKLKHAVEELEAYKSSLEIKVDERTRELVQALAKEKEVVEMKNQFVSIATHEFRAPLSTIEYATNFIKTKTIKGNGHRISSEDLAGNLENIEKQVKHMMHLLDNVLTYGKSEAGKIQLILTKIKPQAFLEKIIEEVGQSTKNSHYIELTLQDLPKEIETDEKLLRNVLTNLLTNAIKYSPGKNVVYLKVKAVDDQLVFKVIDDGMGIPPEELSKVFEAFYRVKSAEYIQGTGLGLSIVKKAVELLKGNIQVESQPGKGTTITVTIPVPLLGGHRG